MGTQTAEHGSIARAPRRSAATAVGPIPCSNLKEVGKNAPLTLRQAREESACVGVGTLPRERGPPLALPLAVQQSAQKLHFPLPALDDEHRARRALRPRLIGHTLPHR
jgi:hypothetical protein